MAVTLRVCFTDEAEERLAQLKQATGCATDEALVRNAIALYECVIQEVLVGGTLFVREAHGNDRQVTVPGGPRL